MKRSILTCALTLSFCALSIASAQADDDIYQALIDNAPEGARPNEAPAVRCSFAGGNVVLGISGQVKATMGYDFGNPQDDPNNFVSLDIPMSAPAGNKSKFMFSAQQSALSLNLVALPGTADQVGMYVTVNLLGDSYTPALEYALLTYRGLSVGLGYTLFADTRAALPTIDYMGPCGYTGAGNAGIQYRKTLDCGVTLGAALELPLVSYTAADAVENVHQRVPAIPLAVSYGWDGGDSWVRLSGVVRNMIYRDMVEQSNRNKVGWGLQLSGSQSLGALPLRVMWQATYGHGITSYFQDYTDKGYDMMPDPANPGRLKDVQAWGGYAGVQFNFSDNVYMCAGYSHVRDYIDRYADGATPWGEQSKYTQYAVGNLFWDINSYLSTGIEYIWGRRVNFDGSQAHDSRLQAMLQFSF